ncbi:MAG: glycosyltransferase family 4 protein [Desulfamplus sp.]|nr:glycosyltransferase family 4 protein [Desulfamplus sp.]
MSKHPLCVISVIMGGLAYQDRMRLLYELDPHVDEHVILTRDDAGEIPTMQNTRIIKARHCLRGIFFSLWAGVISVLIIWRGHQKRHWLINEDFGWFALFLPRILLRNRVTTCVSLFGQSRSMYIKQAWTEDPYVGILSKKQSKYYARRYWSQIFSKKIAISNAHAIIGNSNSIRDDIQKVDPHKPTITIPNSVTLQALQTGPVISTHRTFLYVGVMQPIKGIGLLLEAFSRHSMRRPQDRLILAGRCPSVDQEWFQNLLGQHRKSGHVEHLQHMAAHELTKIYNECDIFLFPSFYEGSPRVIGEVMTYGKPVIASDIPGIRVIDPNGFAIQYFPPGNITVMLRLMRELSEDQTRRKKLGQTSKKIVANFSHERVALRLSLAYRELMTNTTDQKLNKNRPN